MKKSIVFEMIAREEKRQEENLELIASENYVSKAVRVATGSILTNKYAEGYPGRRYYGGCEHIDSIEQYAIDTLKALFKAEHANVQPHSGSQANMAVYLSVLQVGDTILSMDLNSGGHLTHGSSVNFSGKLFNIVHYGLNKESELLDYDEILRIAKVCKPKMIVAGASNYSRSIDFKKFRKIADSVNAYLLVDMAHIAGLVATNTHQSPVKYADFVTSTTHKTLRGPRGGIILCKEKYKTVIDKTIFPGTQGGPLEHVIAAKAIAFEEASKPSFKRYIKNVIENAKAMADTFISSGYHVVSNGTDNHLLSLDVRKFNITGDVAEHVLDSINITCNKNTIPFDPNTPNKPSGIRLGSAALTTRGFTKEDFITIANLIITALLNYDNELELAKLKESVKTLVSKYPLK